MGIVVHLRWPIIPPVHASPHYYDMTCHLLPYQDTIVFFYQVWIFLVQESPGQ